jgi:hypothetical protein
MKKISTIALVLLFVVTLTSCSENYSNGERIGTITRFSEKGMWFKSWEGNLNVTQTGMNSSGEPFEFSMDNDKEQPEIKMAIDSAAQHGWKVKIVYKQVTGWNWWHNRGETDYFVDKVEILDKNFGMNPFANQKTDNSGVTGKVIDTIYVVIDNRK